MKRFNRIILVLIVILLIAFRSLCGIFVIQPIGALPEGTTIIFFRAGLNLPFVSSIDGLLEKSGVGVSLLSRGMMLAKMSEIVIEREIIRFAYSERLYLKSTGGLKYNK